MGPLPGSLEQERGCGPSHRRTVRDPSPSRCSRSESEGAGMHDGTVERERLTDQTAGANM